MEFKVGDKVKVLTEEQAKKIDSTIWYTPHQKSFVGKTGVVISVTDNSNIIKFENHLEELFFNSKLEKVNDKMISYTISGNSLTVYIQGEGMFTVTNSNPSWEELVNELLKDDPSVDTILDLVNLKKKVETYVQGNLSIVGNEVLFKGEPVHGTLVDRILSFMEKGLPFKPLLNFLENLMENPSFRSREQLYGFLEKYQAPITSDGCFIAFKRVRSNFKDIHSGTFDNSPGTLVSMPREKVDDDQNRTCSAGLHACASRYLDQFATGVAYRTVTVKINPRDVVSIPTDYNFSKMRVCQYLVLEEVEPQNVKGIEEQDYYDYGAGLEVEWEDELTLDDFDQGMKVKYNNQIYTVDDVDYNFGDVTIEDENGWGKVVYFGELEKV